MKEENMIPIAQMVWAEPRVNPRTCTLTNWGTMDINGPTHTKAPPLDNVIAIRMSPKEEVPSKIT